MSERSRTHTWTDPRPSTQAGMTMSGMEYLQAMARGELPRPPIASTLGFEGFAVEEGRATFWITPAEHHYNPIGSVHGGLAATLLDSALGCAVHTMLPAGTGYTTVDLKVTFLRPLTEETGRVRAEAEVVHLGGRIATSEARILDEQDRVYAQGSATLLILRGER